MSSLGSLIEVVGDTPVAFGLRAQGHLPTVERMLAEGASWDEIGKAIGWHGPTAQRFYEEIEADAKLERCPGCGGERDHPALRWCPTCRRLGAAVLARTS